MQAILSNGSLIVLLILATASAGAVAAEPARETQANVMIEVAFTAAGKYAAPGNDVTLDVTFTDPNARAFRVPAFWTGGSTWKARYASPVLGTHRFRSESSTADDAGLHGVTGEVVVKPYTGSNPLYVHGPLRVAANKRHFERGDGTPFFWLGDTWWMGLCHRLKWPDDVKPLAADRKVKGFNVIQIVAGLYPDMHPFDPRGANEAGFPWTEGYGAIRPEYFDAADARILHLVDEGFTPCVVGAWGYFIRWMGPDKVKQHWRNLIARYGALPVVWCAAGEANLPWYLAKGFPYDDREQVAAWTDVLRYIRAADPFRRPLTIHPTGLTRLSARHCTDDPALLDFDILQTPHGQQEAVAATLATVRASYADAPRMPVINGEAAYEMLNDSLPTKWARRMFWVSVMNGAPGHTYGANGIWQVNRPGEPHGPSPHHPPGSAGYGKIPWAEAMNLPGSSQVARAKKLFERHPWHTFEPHPEWARFAGEPSSIGLKGAQWIWFPEGNPAQDAPVEKRYLRKQFEVPAGRKIASASLVVTADDAVSVRVNGGPVGSSADWRNPARFDVAAALKQGRNALAMMVENTRSDVTANPAGFLASLDIRFADGESLRIVSDATWRAARAESVGWDKADFDDTAWPAATTMGAYGMPPWGDLSGTTRETPYVLGVADGVRIVYAPRPQPLEISGLAANAAYTATYFDPVAGEETPIGEVRVDENGDWTCPPPKAVKEDDWVVVLEPKRRGARGASAHAPSAATSRHHHGVTATSAARGKTRSR